MQLQILGSGDAFGSGGRFNTCFHLTSSAASLLVDCGASSMVALNRFGVDPDSIDAIVISHFHGDHFGGLPFFLLYAQYESKRERPLILAGPPGLKERVQSGLKACFGDLKTDWRFPLEFVELHPGASSRVLGLSVEPIPVVHGIGPSYALRIDDGEKLFAYSGDTTWTETLPEVARGADLFVVECYAYDEAMPNHCDWFTLSRHLPSLHAQRIMLTHMSAAMLARLDSVSLEAVHDGMVLDL